MPAIFPYRHKQPNTILGDNIYFNRKQLCKMLDISNSHLSKQLKTVLTMPGCQMDYFRTNPREHKKRQHYKSMHYNLNTAVAIAYRVNNLACRKFLHSYSLFIYNLQLKLSGPNYFIPTVLTETEFRSFTEHLIPYNLDHEDG